MRMPKYLSNTSVSLFYTDRMEFYLRYLAENRPPKIPQTRPMSIGSAFDAYVKAYIVKEIIGDRPEFHIDAIFTQQVDPHNRDWARENGSYVFECYKRSGALSDLMAELSQAEGEPRFEFTKRRTIKDIPLLGKPDVWFITRDGLHVLLDWKVNGYCSRKGVSPKAGYLLCYDGWEGDQSKTHMQMHRHAQPMKIGSMIINAAKFLEMTDKSWAKQTCLYGWLMGEEVGGRFICGVDQLVCQPHTDKPRIRIAKHRAKVGATFQQQWWTQIEHCWDVIQSEHIFEDMSKTDSKERQRILDDYHKAYDGNPDDENEKWFREVTREHR